jgi:hypothetical protein
MISASNADALAGLRDRTDERRPQHLQEWREQCGHRSAAVHMADAGVPMEEIAQCLGHSDVEVTRRIYARFSPDYLSGAAAALEYDDIAPARSNRGRNVVSGTDGASTRSPDVAAGLNWAPCLACSAAAHVSGNAL